MTNVKGRQARFTDLSPLKFNYLPFLLYQPSSSSFFFFPVSKRVTAVAAARMIANTLVASFVVSSVLALLAPRTACPLVGSSLLAPSTA